MLTHNEIQRLSGMANALRPDWPVNSLNSFLSKHRQRTYRDLAVALAWVATDVDTQTPARLNENGPWWRAVTAGDSSVRRGDNTMRCPEHGEPYLACQQCKATPVTPPPSDVKAEIAQALEEAKTLRTKRAAEDRDRSERKQT